MTSIYTALSTVSDGSMYNRNDPFDKDVIHNREVFLHKHGLTMDQTTRVGITYDEGDFCRYTEISETEKGNGMKDGDVRVADALITRNKNHALLLPVADCIGTVIFDPEHDILMLSHLGRHSLEQEGGVKSIEFLVHHYGSDPKKLKLWLTPTPNKQAYPIWKLDNKGMKEVAFEQFEKAGVNPANITDDPRDTVTDLNFYSYSEFLKGNREQDGDHIIIAVMR